jgi:hypothetical protein
MEGFQLAVLENRFFRRKTLFSHLDGERAPAVGFCGEDSRWTLL